MQVWPHQSYASRWEAHNLCLPCFFSFVADLYKGQIRTRTIDILLDGEYATSWTSSGSSLGFETIPLPSSVAGQPTSSIELIGAGSDSQWFSVEEVRDFTYIHTNIYSVRSSAEHVTETVSFKGGKPRPFSVEGCCIGAHMLCRSRRSPAYIMCCFFNLKLAQASTLKPFDGARVRLRVFVGYSTILKQVRIMVTVDELPPPTPAPTVVSPPPAVPTTAPTFLNEAPVFGTTIVVTGDLYDTRTAAENGCDPAGCVPTNIRVSPT